VKHWPRVRLGDVLTLRDSSVPVSALGDVRLAGVYSFGRGLFMRGMIAPTRTSYRTYNQLQTDDFVISQPKAWEGALARVTPEFNGWFLSPVFPTFRADRDKLDPAYLEWCCKRESVWTELQRGSRGMGARRETVSPEQFLSLELHLPPVSEQQRIVARIEDVAGCSRTARDLRDLAASELDFLMDGIERRIWPLESLASAKPLDEVTTFLARGRHSEQGESDHRLIKTQHVQQGRYVPTVLTLAPHVAARVTPDAVARPGDVLIACSAAGCLGRVARYEDRGYPTSTDTHVAIARANEDVIDPEYLYVYLRGATGQHQLRSRERGDWEREKVGFRLTELNLKDLKNVPVPLPDKGTQRRLVEEVQAMRSQVDAARRLQAEIAVELDALLPAILDRAFKGEL
jgi:type I restriction enzyme S subunit